MLEISDKYALEKLSKSELIARYIRLKEEVNKKTIINFFNSIKAQKTIEKTIEQELIREFRETGC